MVRFIRIVLITTILAVGLALGAFLALRSLYNRPGPGQMDQVIIVEKKSTLRQVARLMEQKRIIKNAELFLATVRLFNANNVIQAGEYNIPARESMKVIFGRLQSGDVVAHKVTIVEGMSAIQVYDRLMANDILTGTIDIPEEGSTLPQTYRFYRGESRKNLLNKMREAMNEALSTAWESRDRSIMLKNKREVLILASIIEKETARKRELPVIAGVYYNRLRQNMRLQADPTVIYPVTKGLPIRRRILKSELRDVNPYNTYVIYGLPKGPICNPSARALVAATHPEKTDAIFFVADGRGGHRFAKTLKEHNSNVNRWRSLRAQKDLEKK